MARHPAKSGCKADGYLLNDAQPSTSFRMVHSAGIPMMRARSATAPVLLPRAGATLLDHQRMTRKQNCHGQSRQVFKVNSIFAELEWHSCLGTAAHLIEYQFSFAVQIGALFVEVYHSRTVCGLRLG